MKTTREYRKMSDEELKKQLKRNKLEISKSYGRFSIAKVKSAKTGKLLSQGDATAGIGRRLRKENARILTVLKERKNDIKNR